MQTSSIFSDYFPNNDHELDICSNHELKKYSLEKNFSKIKNLKCIVIHLINKDKSTNFKSILREIIKIDASYISFKIHILLVSEFGLNSRFKSLIDDLRTNFDIIYVYCHKLDEFVINLSEEIKFYILSNTYIFQKS